MKILHSTIFAVVLFCSISRLAGQNNETCRAVWLAHPNTESYRAFARIAENVTDREECKTACLSDLTCVAFEFRNTTKVCYRIEGFDYETRTHMPADDIYFYFLIRCTKGPTTCKYNDHGFEYVGLLNKTRTGADCIPWKEKNSIDDAGMTRHKNVFSDGDEIDAENYCRNPTRDPRGPWCYTSTDDQSYAYEYCDIPFCDNRSCSSDQLGLEYTGQVDVTRNGLPCQRWFNGIHGYTSNHGYEFPDGSDKEAKNFCRNPTNDTNGPWCVLLFGPPLKDYCNIPECANDTTVAQSTEYWDSNIEVNETTHLNNTETCRAVWMAQAHRGVDGAFIQRMETITDRAQCKLACHDDLTCLAVEFSLTTRECILIYGYKWGFQTFQKKDSFIYSIIRCSQASGPTTRCRHNDHGYEYVGLQNRTLTGVDCQPWREHSSSRSNRYSVFSDGDEDDAENYCRNPNRDPLGPWCYTSTDDQSYEYCDIPFCSDTYCSSTVREYTGHINVTRGGLTCQPWSSNLHVYNNKYGYTFPDGRDVDAQNFCRNPTNDTKGPWCLVVAELTPPYIDYCNTSLQHCYSSATGLYSSAIESTTETVRAETREAESTTTKISMAQASTTQAVTNQERTNQASTKQASTTQASTHQESTNQASTHQASTHQASTHQASTNQASTNQASTTEAAASTKTFVAPLVAAAVSMFALLLTVCIVGCVV